jgi:hypothetical protein
MIFGLKSFKFPILNLCVLFGLYLELQVNFIATLVTWKLGDSNFSSMYNRLIKSFI